MSSSSNQSESVDSSSQESHSEEPVSEEESSVEEENDNLAQPDVQEDSESESEEPSSSSSSSSAKPPPKATKMQKPTRPTAAAAIATTPEVAPDAGAAATSARAAAPASAALTSSSAAAGGALPSFALGSFTITPLMYLGLAAFFLAAIIVLPVVLTLPESYSCSPLDAKYFVKVISPPSLNDSVPSLICNYQRDSPISIDGRSFVLWNGANPALYFNGTALNVNLTKCSKFDIRKQDAQMCSGLDTTVPMVQDVIPPFMADVNITLVHPIQPHPTANVDHFDTCQADSRTILGVFPPPLTNDVMPPVICNKAVPRNLTVLGQYFFVLQNSTTMETHKPRVVIQKEGNTTAFEVDPVNIYPIACVDLTLRVGEQDVFQPIPGVTIQMCDQVLVTVNPMDHYDADLTANNLTIINPGSIDCTSPVAVQFRVVDEPDVVIAEPPMRSVFYAAQQVELTTSTGYLQVDGSWGTYLIEKLNSTVTSSSGCRDLSLRNHNIVYCSAINISIPQNITESPVVAEFMIMPPFIEDCTVTSTFAGALTLVPPAQFDDVVPFILCPSTPSFDLSGRYFYNFNGSLPTAAITGPAAGSVISVSLSNCVDIAVPRYSVQQCDTATVQIDTSLFDPATVVNSVTTTGPAPVDVVSNGHVDVVFSGAALVSQVTPPVICREVDVNMLSFTGPQFFIADLTMPSATYGVESILDVNIASGCQSVTVLNHNLQICTSGTFSLPVMSGLMVHANPNLTFTYDASKVSSTCNFASSNVLLTVPPPRMSAPYPGLCSTQTSVTLVGSYFLSDLNGAAPSISADGVPRTFVPSGCVEINPAPVPVNACTSVTFDITSQPAVSQFYVNYTNPVPAACTGSQLFTKIPTAQLTSANPATICSANTNQTVTITGSFPRLPGYSPRVLFSGLEMLFVDFAGVCTTGANYDTCTQLLVATNDVTLPVGAITVRVEIGCGVESTGILSTSPAPTISTVSPSSFCLLDDVTFTVTGQNIQVISPGTVAEVKPTVRLGGQNIILLSVSGCTSYTGYNLCTNLTALAPASTVGKGMTTLEVINGVPSAASCVDLAQVRAVPLPTITSFAPSRTCFDQDFTIDINGTDFMTDFTTIRLRSSIDTNLFYTPDVTSILSDTRASVTFYANKVRSGFYNLVAANIGGNCTFVTVDTLHVQPKVLVFFVDPEVVYNGVSVQATVYTTGLVDQVKLVEMFSASGVQNLTYQTADTLVLGSFNKIGVVLPQGIAIGDWSIKVTSQIGCTAFTSFGFRVTDTVTVSVGTPDPSFAWTDARTGITITTESPMPTGKIGFEATPRLYLSPVAGGLAAPLSSTVFQNMDTLTAVVSNGLSVGAYDLIVINPSGTVGYKASAVQIISQPPPVVSSITPNSIAFNANQLVSIEGSNFRVSSASSIVARCVSATGVVRAPCAATGLTTSTNTTISVTIPFATCGSFSASDACLVDVTNSDTSLFTFASISLKEPAQKLPVWSATSTLNVARRGLASVPVSITSKSKQMLAVGGDGSTGAVPNQVFDTIESASIGDYGTLGNWTVQRNKLPEPLAFTKVMNVGRYVYVAGGWNGTAASNGLYRAHILDPSETTPIGVNVNVNLDSVTVFSGVYFYAVSAVFPVSYQYNPGGESLIGEKLIVRLPAGISGLELQLNWTRIPQATGYRLYRTPTAGASASQMQLLVELSGGANVSYVDTGVTATDASRTPLPDGSLGVWHVVAGSTMPVARWLHAAVAYPDSSNSNTYYIAVQGGDSTSSLAALPTDYFYIRIDVSSPVSSLASETHTVSAWTQVASATYGGRFGHHLARLSKFDSPTCITGDQSVVLFTAANPINTDWNAANVTATGDLSSVASSTQGTAYSGNCFFHAGGYLYSVHGASGAFPGTLQSTVDFRALSATCSNSNWMLDTSSGNNWANALNYPPVRAFSGCADVNSNYYMIGGSTGTGSGTPSNTVYRTNH